MLKDSMTQRSSPLFRTPSSKMLYILMLIGLIFVTVFYSKVNRFRLNAGYRFNKSVPEEEDLREPLTLHCNEGRLGNQMCTLAVLKGLATLNGRLISILPCNKKSLDPYFEIKEHEVNISAFVEHDQYDIRPYLHPEDKNISDTTNIIKGYLHPCSFTFFNHIRQNIRKTFRFRKEFRTYAEETLSRAKGDRKNVTFVGVHVRRGDYVRNSMHSWLWAFGGRLVDKEYFEKATKYFREKYSNVLFIVVSDDLPWCRENLKDLNMYIPDESLGPAYDMATLAQCNHTLMTYGTFGFWGAYLAGGDVVYFDKFLKPGTNFSERIFRFEKMYLPEWVGMDTTKPDFWDTYLPLPLRNKRQTESARNNFTTEPLTIHCNQGRLGNQMCSLAVLQGVAVLNHRNISILPCNKKVLNSYFDLKVPEVNTSTFVERNPHLIGHYLTTQDKYISNKTNIIKGNYHPCSFTFFNHIRQDIRKTFHFRENFRSNAEEILWNVRGNETNVTFVGVHVRRGDYITRTQSSWLWAFDGREVDREYFEKATMYFRDKYPNVKFIVASEDLPWCRKNLKDFDMYIPEKSLGPAYDMALLAQCNHTLMTYGTFGFWGGYLAGGDVVYFDKFLKPGTQFTNTAFRFEMMYLPEWTGIDTTKRQYWDTYVRPPLDQQR